MSRIERYNWIIIYLNIPLWIAVGVLLFAFHRWDIAKWLVYVNIAALSPGLFFSGKKLVNSGQEERYGPLQ